MDSAWRVKAGLSRKARAPGIAQLYDSARGNPNLKMEETTTAELGTSWKASANTTVDATLFRSAIRNFIQSDADGRQQNQDRYRNTGLELQLRSVAGPVQYGAGYTYLVGKDQSGETGNARTLQYLPRHRLTLDAQWHIDERTLLSADLLYVGKQDYYSRGTTVQSDQLPSYVLINSRLAYTLPGTKTQLYVGVDNLFDRVYATSYGFPQEGRYAYIGVNQRF